LIEADADKLIPPAFAVTLMGSSPVHPVAKYVLVAIPLDVVIGELIVAND